MAIPSLFTAGICALAVLVAGRTKPLQLRFYRWDALRWCITTQEVFTALTTGVGCESASGRNSTFKVSCKASGTGEDVDVLTPYGAPDIVSPKTPVVDKANNPIHGGDVNVLPGRDVDGCA